MSRGVCSEGGSHLFSGFPATSGLVLGLKDICHEIPLDRSRFLGGLDVNLAGRYCVYYRNFVRTGRMLLVAGSFD